MAASDDEEDFAALFAASEEGRKRERRIAAGDVIRGRVIAVGATAAFVAVGGKAEATIDLGEFRDPETGEVQLHEGDEIEATVVDDGSRSASIVLKRVAGRGGPLRDAAGRPADRGAGREARAGPERRPWPRGAVAPCTGTGSLGDGGRTLSRRNERLRHGAAARAVRRLRGARPRSRRPRARLPAGARPPGIASAADRVGRRHRRRHGRGARRREAAHRPLDGRARPAGEGGGRGGRAARYRAGARAVEPEDDPRDAPGPPHDAVEAEAAKLGREDV